VAASSISSFFVVLLDDPCSCFPEEDITDVILVKTDVFLGDLDLGGDKS
jgi:hypothetical protein